MRKGGTRSRGNSRNSRNSRGRQGGRSPNRSPNRSQNASRSPNGRGPRTNSAGGRPKRGSGAGRGPRPARQSPGVPSYDEESTVFGSETFGASSDASTPYKQSTMLDDEPMTTGSPGSGGFGLIGMLVVGFVVVAAAVVALAFIPGMVCVCLFVLLRVGKKETDVCVAFLHFHGFLVCFFFPPFFPSSGSFPVFKTHSSHSLFSSMSHCPYS